MIGKESQASSAAVDYLEREQYLDSHFKIGLLELQLSNVHFNIEKREDGIENSKKYK